MSSRRRRLLLVALLALAVTPVTWLRSPRKPRNDAQVMQISPLPVPQRQEGPMRLLGAWQLSSPNTRFGGFSALLMMPGRRLLAASDRGDMVLFAPPGEGRSQVRIGPFPYGAAWRMGFVDLEALSRDPASGRIWSGYEMYNMILRMEGNLSHRIRIRPRTMAGWMPDFGPEAMVRLADGRFIVLAERDPGWFSATTPGLVFPDDPLTRHQPARFRLRSPRGYSPTDMAQLPDGRVLILFRRLRVHLPLAFSCRIAIADPADIRRDREWRPRVIADIDGPVPSDNYEGLAIDPAPGGTSDVWVISDANDSPFERTLLLKYRFDPKAKGARIDRTPLANQ